MNTCTYGKYDTLRALLLGRENCGPADKSILFETVFMICNGLFASFSSLVTRQSLCTDESL